MAHQITIRENGKAEMAYVNQKPWHGLGTALDVAPDADTMIQASGLDWSVSKMNMLIPSGMDADGNMFSDIKVPEKVAIVRNDNKTVLGVVGEDYSPIQNHEAFAFFESLIGCGSLKYETAGSLFGGRRIFAVAKTENQVRIHGTDDVSENYICVFNSHDGSLALKCFFTNVRICCNNTLQIALKGAKNAISIRHTGNISSRIEEARTILNINAEYTHKFEEVANHLAQKQVDRAMVDKFLKDCFKPVNKDSEEESTRSKNLQNQVRNLFDNDPKNNLKGIEGTAWSLYNAVTQFADHEAVSVRKSADNRMNSIMFGNSANLKQKAFDLALSI